MLRATMFLRAAEVLGKHEKEIPFDLAVLASDERHVRRKVIQLVHGDKVLVDFPKAVVLEHHDVLVLDDGRHAEIIAAEERLYDVRGRNPVHLAELAWHVGNRHLAAQIDEQRILILRDHVIKAMLEGLGATVSDTQEIFEPIRGAYSGGHAHDHGHDHDGHHGHHHHDNNHHRHD
jgi:urease accessory protein